MDLERDGVPTAADSRCCGWCEHWSEGCGICGICEVKVCRLDGDITGIKLADCMTMYEDGSDCPHYREVE